MIANSLPMTLSASSSEFLLILICLMLTLTTMRLIFATSLLETVILMSVFSLLITLSYLLMDAPDVAMTEAALGSCLSTCVLLNFIRKLPAGFSSKNIFFSGTLSVLFALVLFWLALDLPPYGEPLSPLQTHVSKYYIDNTGAEIGIPSFVAAILASYRGYDTLGETSVILIAGIAVLFIMSSRPRKS